MGFGYWFGRSDWRERRRNIAHLSAGELSHDELSARELRDDYERLQVANKQLSRERDEWQALAKRQAAARLKIPDRFRGFDD